MAVQQIDHFESASASASHRCESRLLWGGSERHTAQLVAQPEEDPRRHEQRSDHGRALRPLPAAIIPAQVAAHALSPSDSPSRAQPAKFCFGGVSFC